MAGQFEIKRSSNGEFFFNLTAPNGAILLVSNRYSGRSEVDSGINSVKANAPIDTRYQRKESSAGEFYFLLKAVNGLVLGRGEMYPSTAAMENAIRSTKTIAPTARIVDNSS